MSLGYAIAIFAFVWFTLGVAFGFVIGYKKCMLDEKNNRFQ